MIGKSIRYYLFIGILLFFVFFFKLDMHYLSIYLVCIFSFIISVFVFNYCNSRSERFFNNKILFFIVFFYSLFFVAINNFISYYFDGNFFVFSTADAVYYHEEAQSILQYGSLIKGWAVFLGIEKLDNFGAVAYISFIYQFIESNLFVNFFNIIFGSLTAILLFGIGKKIMSVKYAFFASLTYAISSFVIWFYSSGLKETIMVFIIVSAFYSYYMYYFSSYDKKLKYILFLTMSLLALLLFRPIIIFFILFSIGFGYFLTKRNIYSLIIGIAVLIPIVLNFDLIQSALYAYMGREDIGEMLEIQHQSGKIQNNTLFTYITHFLSSVFGQFPTFNLGLEKIKILLYSSGLLYKTIISLFFLLSIYYSIKKRIGIVYPIIFYSIIEILSLVFILQALEIRKSMPHIPLVFLLCFWMMDKYQNKQQNLKITRSKINVFFLIYVLLVSSFILLWNFR